MKIFLNKFLKRIKNFKSLKYCEFEKISLKKYMDKNKKTNLVFIIEGYHWVCHEHGFHCSYDRFFWN